MNTSTATRPTPFAATLASEWTKLTTLRSTWVVLAVGFVVALAMTALLTIVVGVTWDDWPAAERRTFEPIGPALVGTLFSAIALAVIGVNAVANEYSSGMMRLTLTATPRRDRVLLAKAAVVAAITVAAGTATTLATFLLGQAILGSYDLETASLGDWHALRVIVAGSSLSPVMPVIGAALAFVVRSKVGAIMSLLGLVFAPEILGPLLPASWQDHVLIYLPGAASDALAYGGLEDEAAHLGPVVALAVLGAWTAAFLGAGYLALAQRDAS